MTHNGKLLTPIFFNSAVNIKKCNKNYVGNFLNTHIFKNNTECKKDCSAFINIIH